MCSKQKKKFLVKVGSHSKLSLLLESDNLEEVKKEIENYINRNIKKCFYQRVIYHDMHIWIDYGSWTNFIYVYFKDVDTKREYIGEETWKRLNEM